MMVDIFDMSASGIAYKLQVIFTAGALCFTLAVLCCFCYVAYLIVTLPLRRQERAHLFLDIVEECIKQGRNIEESIVRLAGEGEEALGRHFYALASCIRGGLTLSESLKVARGILPVQTCEMLAVGEESGDIGRMLPACRETLTDGVSRARSAINYLVVILFGVGWTGLCLQAFISVFIMPKYMLLFEDTGMPQPVLLAHTYGFACFAVSLAGSLFLISCMIIYIGGPWLAMRLSLESMRDRLCFLLPWRRKRIQSAFSATLAVLLDAGVPEEQAVTLAAKSTASSVFIDRARAVTDGLRRGVRLPEAIRHIDDSGEFRWRLENACHAHCGFLEALSGWHEALQAKAYQQEQAAAHVITTGIVLCNGAVVGLLAISFFEPLIRLTEGMLW